MLSIGMDLSTYLDAFLKRGLQGVYSIKFTPRTTGLKSYFYGSTLKPSSVKVGRTMSYCFKEFAGQ